MSELFSIKRSIKDYALCVRSLRRQNDYLELSNKGLINFNFKGFWIVWRDDKIKEQEYQIERNKDLIEKFEEKINDSNHLKY